MLLALTAGCSLPGAIVVDDVPSADVPTLDGSDGSLDATDVVVPRDVLDAGDVVDVVDTGPSDAYSSAVSAPRPISPPSGSIQANNHVTLEWQLPAGTTGAIVELCPTRACTTATTVPVPGSVTTLALSTAQVHSTWNYWRLRGTAAGAISSTTSPTWQFEIPSNTTGPRSGHYGAVLDWDGDGEPDLAVGASTGVSLYRGTTAGYSDPPAATLTSAGFPGFGAYVASVGDVDGNGLADLVVIAQGATAGAGRNAIAFVYHSDGTGYPAAPDQVPLASTTIRSVSWAGDLNHDGYADVVLGATNGSSQNHDSGEIYVLFGSNAPIVTATALPNNSMGYVVGVSGAGDVDGDGYDDFAVGTGTYSSTFGPSAAYLFAGGATLASMAATTIAEPGNQHFDGTVTGGCDFNQDGWPDLGFGVYPGGAGGSTGVERFHAAGGSFQMMYQDSALGYTGFVGAISCGGDVSGDGDDDLVFTIPSATAGAATVHVLSAAHATASSASFGSVILGTQVGDALSVIGDYDGDGLMDVALGGGGGIVAIIRGAVSAPYLSTAPGGIDTVNNSDTSFGTSLALRRSLGGGRFWALEPAPVGFRRF